jgi:polysaccharide export outer membrane protein
MSTRFSVWIAILLFAVAALTGCAGGAPRAGAQPMTAVTQTRELPAPDTTSSSGAYEGVSEYRVGPQDLIEISVFQVADLNRTVRLNSAGQISLPLIGAVRAGGKTVQELEAEIARRLSERYLQNPQVTVFVKEFASQRVTLEGAVKSPGIYPLTGRTSLIQAIAMAQGLDPLANPRGVVIFRMIEGKKMAAVFDIAAIRAGNLEDPRIYGDDIIVVEQSGSKTALRRFIESVPMLSYFVLF